MRFSLLNSLRAVFPIVLLVLSGCHSRPQAFLDGMQSYHGAGLIEDTTIHSLYRAFPGLQISLPLIDTASEHEVTFNLGKLPPTHDRTLSFYLRLNSVDDLHLLVSKLSLTLDLQDETGAPVYHHSGIRYYPQRNPLLTSFQAPLVKLDPNKAYTLHVTCTSRDPSFQPRIKLVLRGGGFI